MFFIIFHQVFPSLVNVFAKSRNDPGLKYLFHCTIDLFMLWKGTKEISYLKYDYIRKEHLIRMNNSNILRGKKTACVCIVRTHIALTLCSHHHIYLLHFGNRLERFVLKFL